MLISVDSSNATKCGIPFGHYGSFCFVKTIWNLHNLSDLPVFLTVLGPFLQMTILMVARKVRKSNNIQIDPHPVTHGDLV